jgi:hypothetical protein
MGWLSKHGSTIAMVLVFLGMVQQYAQYLPGKWSGLVVAGAGALVKLIQSFTGTTSGDATPSV